MPKVTIDLNDLKRLVDTCLQADVRSRAQTVVLSQAAQSNPVGAIRYADLVEEAMPQAGSDTWPRYRDLLDALESGDGVADALASFVR